MIKLTMSNRQSEAELSLRRLFLFYFISRFLASAYKQACLHSAYRKRSFSRDRFLAMPI